MRESDTYKRFDMFNKAMLALKTVRKYAKKDAGKKAQTDLAIGKINTLKAQAEKEFGTQEKSEEYRGEAIGAYQVMMMFSDPREATVRPYLEEAFQRCLPLLFDAGQWKDVLADSEKYLKLFPSGEFASEIRMWKNKALVKQRMEGGPASSEEPAGEDSE